MLTTDQVLMLYEAIGDLTAQMLSAAGDNDWERMTLLERQCAAHVQTLRDNDASAHWNAPSRAKKADLIRKILADDRHIRDLVTPWMAELARSLNSAGTERKLHRAYGSV